MKELKKKYLQENDFFRWRKTKVHETLNFNSKPVL